MAAAARKAVQHHAMQLGVATCSGAAIADLTAADMTLRLPKAILSVPHGWDFLLDRRPTSAVCPLGVPCTKAWNYVAARGYYMRNISQLVAPANGKRAFLVDTLALVISAGYILLGMIVVLQFANSMIQVHILEI